MKIKIKNNFDYTIPAGDTLFVSYQMMNAKSTDTLVLKSDFAGLDDLTYTFRDTLSLASQNDYDISCAVSYYRDAVRSNDTAKRNFRIYGNPIVSLGQDTVFTTKPDTVMLDAGTGFDSFIWNTGSTEMSFYAPYATSYNYVVTATDMNGCFAIDSVSIISTDLALGAIISPIDSCKLSPSTNVSFEVINLSNDLVPSGDKLSVSISANGTEVIAEQIAMPQILPGAKAVIYTVGRIDLSAFTTVNLTVSFTYIKDADPANNTAAKTLSPLGDPQLKLNTNKLFIADNQQAKVYPLAKYAKYEWSTLENSDTIYIAGTVKGWTYLTVTDANGCKGKDSVAVQNRDFSISLVSSFSDCKLPSNQQIKVLIKNEGVDILTPSEPVKLILSFDGVKVVQNSLPISLAGLETYSYTFPDSYDFSNKSTVEIKVSAEVVNDVISGNNTDVATMIAYGYPEPKFAQDTIFAPVPSSISLSVPGTYTSYQWQDASSSPAFVGCTDNSAWYYLTVTNSEGCTGKDSVYVFTPDISVLSLVSPVDACVFDAEEPITVNIKNTGAESFAIGKSIYINASVNGTSLVTDTVVLTSALSPGGELVHIFSKKLPTASVSKFNLVVSLLDMYDASKSNNVLSAIVQKTGYPTVSFDRNLILTNRPDTISFNFPIEYSYQWSDGNTSHARSATADQKQYFKLTATNSTGCTTVDSLTILSVMPEIESSPTLISACQHSGTEIASANIVNNGLAGISAIDAVSVIFTLDGVQQAQISVVDLAAGASSVIECPVTFDLSAVGSYRIGYYTAIAVYGQTVLVDSSIAIVETYGFPADAIKETVLRGKLPLTITAAGASSYKWSNGKTSPSILVSTSGKFYVTVTNSHGCERIDSVVVGGFDIAIDSIIFPQGNIVCTSDLKEYPKLSIRNSGLDTLLPGTTIELVVNKISETVSLSDSLLPSETLLLKPAAKLSTALGVKTIAVAVSLADDVEPANNTKSLSYTMFRSPSFDFLGDASADTVDVKPPFVLFGPDKYKYNWSTGSISQSITATSQGEYTLTITDNQGCTGTDVIFLRMETSSGEKIDGIIFEVFPTICDQEFSIVPSGYVASARLTIVAYGSGYSKDIPLGAISGIQTINVSDLPAGGYTLRLAAAGCHY